MVWSVGAAALEGLKHQIAHRPDIGLDAFQPIGIVVAILCPLAIGAVACGVKFPVKPGQHRIVGKCLACDRGRQRDRAANYFGKNRDPDTITSAKIAEMKVCFSEQGLAPRQ